MSELAPGVGFTLTRMPKALQRQLRPIVDPEAPRAVKPLEKTDDWV